jgi:hypothetical protein
MFLSVGCGNILKRMKILPLKVSGIWDWSLEF